MDNLDTELTSKRAEKKPKLSENNPHGESSSSSSFTETSPVESDSDSKKLRTSRSRSHSEERAPLSTLRPIILKKLKSKEAKRRYEERREYFEERRARAAAAANAQTLSEQSGDIAVESEQPFSSQRLSFNPDYKYEALEEPNPKKPSFNNSEEQEDQQRIYLARMRGGFGAKRQDMHNERKVQVEEKIYKRNSDPNAIRNSMLSAERERDATVIFKTKEKKIKQDEAKKRHLRRVQITSKSWIH
jgi:hypothetical protein